MMVGRTNLSDLGRSFIQAHTLLVALAVFNSIEMFRPKASHPALGKECWDWFFIFLPWM
jgi:hypothetical protein